VRDSALIESYFPVYTTRLMRALWDQIDATSVFSIQLYESYKHFYVLNRYLELVEYRPIPDDEIVETRRATLDLTIADGLAELARSASTSPRTSFCGSRVRRPSPYWPRLRASSPGTSFGTRSLPTICSTRG